MMSQRFFLKLIVCLILSQTVARLLATDIALAQARTLVPPKGYEHIKPATLYLSESGGESWVVAESPTEAVNIQLNIDKRGTATWRSYWEKCLLKLDECEEPLRELGFGWFALIEAHNYGGNSNITEKSFYAYEASSPQEAITQALSDYRKGRNGFVIQKLHVGLVSKIDWSEVASEYEKNGAWIEPRSELNYREICDWTMFGRQYGGERSSSHDQYGRNIHPDIFNGVTDKDPNCETIYRPSDKLPLPKLKVVP